MYLSHGNKLISFLQLQATIVTILIMLFFGEAFGRSKSRRMPIFYGKRSGESKYSRTSPNFGLGSYESLLSSLSSSFSGQRDDGYALNSPRDTILMNLLSGKGLVDAVSEEDISFLKDFAQNYGEEFPRGLKEKRTVGINSVGNEELRAAIKKLSEYRELLENIIEANLSDQNRLSEDFTDDDDDWSRRSRDESALKRGTLSRLPQFYGRRK